jgi:drug/metabolite transporter (DMT)-like permease
VVGLITLAWSLGSCIDRPGQLLASAFAQDVPINALLLIVFPTILSFGILTEFQPQVDPTRAALLYLCEPIFASAYAWIFAGKSLAPVELFGAVLILSANGIVELLAPKKV